MPAVYSAYALRQNAPALKAKREPEVIRDERRPVPMPTKISPERKAVVIAMWGKPLGEIAQAIERSTGYVSRIARELGLPSRKHVSRKLGPMPGEKDAKLTEVWHRTDMTAETKARHAGFSSAYAARRRARRIGLEAEA